MKNLENYGVHSLSEQDLLSIDGGDIIDGYDSWSEISPNAGTEFIAFTAGIVSLVTGGWTSRIAGAIGWLAY